MDSSSRMRAGWAIATASALALASSAALAAGSGGPQKIRYTAADQAAARSAVARRADLVPAGAWQGGSHKLTKADLAPLSCPGFHPKVSDLVVTGGASSSWRNGPNSVQSVAEVLRTPAMVRSDWRRTVQVSGVLGCYAETLGKAAGPSAKVSFHRRVPFPHVAPYSAAFYVELEVKSQGLTIPVAVWTVLVGKGRTEITLSSTGLKGASPGVGDLLQVAMHLLARASA